jgi:hypothetical protein
MMGLRFHPKGNEGHVQPHTLNIPTAESGKASDQKKFCRSMVQPHMPVAPRPERQAATSVAEGRAKRGGTDKMFTPRRSAMKAAFSDDFGLRKTVALHGASGLEQGQRNPSLASAPNMTTTTELGWRTVNSPPGTKQ